MLVLSRIYSLVRKPGVSFGILCSLTAAGCSQVQMGYNVLSFDAAIADTANQQLLLNAVRASQHYPKSFTQPGDLKATPPVSGGLESTFNLARIDGLNTFNFTPKVAVDGGYSEFSLKNLNYEEYMINIRKDIDPRVTATFWRNPNWPEQLRDLLYIQGLKASEQVISQIDSRRKSICLRPAPGREAERCDLLQKQIEAFKDRCADPHSQSHLHFIDLAVRMNAFRRDPNMYYNTASNYCHYNRFRIFLEEAHLAKRICSPPQTGCVYAVQRTALYMSGYLGELIAAQNYISEHFVPEVMVGKSVGSEFKFFDVPLFEVRTGPPGQPASVLVMHEGAPYYIPRPDFGSPTEARSMQRSIWCCRPCRRQPREKTYRKRHPQ